jgi:hypothetical protein
MLCCFFSSSTALLIKNRGARIVIKNVKEESPFGSIPGSSHPISISDDEDVGNGGRNSVHGGFLAFGVGVFDKLLTHTEKQRIKKGTLLISQYLIAEINAYGGCIYWTVQSHVGISMLRLHDSRR